MSSNDKYRFHGKTYEVDDNGNNHKLINSDNLIAGESIAIEKVEGSDNVKISSSLGLSVVDGLICATYEENWEGGLRNGRF